MEKTASKRPLSEEPIPPLISDPNEAMEIFGELLERGRSLYPDHETSTRHSRIYRIIALEQS